MFDIEFEDGAFEKLGDKTTKWVEFVNEDILIADPCYVIDHDKADRLGCVNDHGCTDLSRLEMLGFTTYLAKFTHGGDQSGYVINSDTDEVIGQYGVDGATWGVFKLSEVLKNDPDAANFINSYTHMRTVIPNFTGKVRIELKRVPGFFSKRGESLGEMYYDSIVGIGSTNFYTVNIR